MVVSDVEYEGWLRDSNDAQDDELAQLGAHRFF